MAHNFSHKINLICLEMEQVKIKTKIKTFFLTTNPEVALIIFHPLEINKQTFHKVTRQTYFKVAQTI
jgi:hypothetical protein